MSAECLSCGTARKGAKWELEDYCSPKCKNANECRFCGNKRKENVKWPYKDYCSGKCKSADGGTIEPAPVRSKSEGKVASLADYLLYYPKNLGQMGKNNQRIKGLSPKLYRRRHDPERLNWGTYLDTKQLKQAGFRANRAPLPGDWDYVDPKPANPIPVEPFTGGAILKECDNE